MIEYDSVLVKYNKIGNKIKKTLNIHNIFKHKHKHTRNKFHSIPVYDKKYIKTKVKELNGVVTVMILI